MGDEVFYKLNYNPTEKELTSIKTNLDKRNKDKNKIVFYDDKNKQFLLIDKKDKRIAIPELTYTGNKPLDLNTFTSTIGSNTYGDNLPVGVFTNNGKYYTKGPNNSNIELEAKNNGDGTVTFLPLSMASLTEVLVTDNKPKTDGKKTTIKPAEVKQIDKTANEQAMTYEKAPDWINQIDQQNFKAIQPKAYNWMDSSQNSLSGLGEGLVNSGYDAMKKKMMKDQAEKIYGKIENGMYQRPVTQREQLDTFMKLKQMENIDFDNSIANKRVGIQEEMLKLRQAYDTAKKSGNEEQANIYKLLLEKMGNEKY
jgi:hypothetical protein